jgi:hypothetical protein
MHIIVLAELLDQYLRPGLVVVVTVVALLFTTMVVFRDELILL